MEAASHLAAPADRLEHLERAGQHHGFSIINSLRHRVNDSAAIHRESGLAWELAKLLGQSVLQCK